MSEDGRGIATCQECGKDLLYGKHMRSEVCAPADQRCTDEELNRLYAALDAIELRPGDMIPQLRRLGRRVRFLSELSSLEVRKLTQECEATAQKRASR